MSGSHFRLHACISLGQSRNPSVKKRFVTGWPSFLTLRKIANRFLQECKHCNDWESVTSTIFCIWNQEIGGTKSFTCTLIIAIYFYCFGRAQLEIPSG